MSEQSNWTTEITEVKPNEVRLRGYRIDELMGQTSFAQAIYLALRGELPSPAVGQLIDAMLVSSIDHGATPPSTLAARTAASTGAPLNAAIAAGVLSINRFHGGAIQDCMDTLLSLIERSKQSQQPIGKVADDLVAEYTDQGRRFAGLGHRIHTNDPRSARLFALAEQAGVSGQGVKAIHALVESYARRGKNLPINVDGALAAILVDLQFPPELGNAFFIIARVPGLVAQIYEEQTTQKPMRHIHPTDQKYAGPPARVLEEKHG
mgnify:CR=1 FL=1